MVFDPVGHQAFLFSGRSNHIFGLKYYNDLWAFEPGSKSWVRLYASNSPPARLNPGMIYDPLNHQIILFGGHNAKGRLADTWRYLIEDNRWEDISPENSPPARSDMGIAYDTEQRVVVLFSGYCDDGNHYLCADTWTFDPEQLTWVEKGPSLSPPPTYGHSLLYDPASKKTILWGGHSATYQNGQIKSIGYGNTFWFYNYQENSWRAANAIKDVNPPPRYWHQAALNPVEEVVLVFSGDGGKGYLADTWQYNIETETWKQVNAPGSPRPRTNAAAAYDPINGLLILFGGLDENGDSLGDTWVLQMTENGGEWESAVVQTREEGSEPSKTSSR
jgi:hypothetical protein